jgi:hypothetical protein
MLKELDEIKEKVLNYAKTNFPNLQVYAIILYGGACKYHFGIEGSRLNDYDLNLFFISDTMNRRFSNRGRVNLIGEHEGKHIEVWRNLIVDKNYEFNIEFLKNFIKKMERSSKRWKTICNNKILLIYPHSQEIIL